MTTEDPVGDRQDLKALAHDRADWLVDAVATSTQNRAFLRGDPEEDKAATESIYLNGRKAITVALEKMRDSDAATIAEREAEIERLLKHRSALTDGVVAAERDYRATEAEAARLKEALRPFSAMAGELFAQRKPIMPEISKEEFARVKAAIERDLLFNGTMTIGNIGLAPVILTALDLAASASSPEPEEWLPIASAPKGRKVIAGYWNPNGKWRSIMACYYPANTLKADEDSWDEFAPEGWYEESETQDVLQPVSEPTHWRPLRPPASRHSDGERR